MDPDRALKEIRKSINRLRELNERGEGWEKTAPLAVEIIDMVQDLDEWIMMGGYVPTDWHNANRRAMRQTVYAIPQEDLEKELAFATAALDNSEATKLWHDLIKERINNA